MVDRKFQDAVAKVLGETSQGLAKARREIARAMPGDRAATLLCAANAVGASLLERSVGLLFEMVTCRAPGSPSRPSVISRNGHRQRAGYRLVGLDMLYRWNCRDKPHGGNRAAIREAASGRFLA